jgi:sorting and assembly machinery component 37
LYNTIQPFPLPYLTPNSVRTAAKLRTEHLGFSGLDIDSDGTKTEHSIIPQSLRTSRATVSSLLAASPEAQARIRLDALARNFLEQLQDLKGVKTYLISDEQFSSLDCLALGYLSLMLIPDLPQPWLSKTIRTDFPQLATWTEELKGDVFGSSVTVEDAMLRGQDSSEKTSLPWKAPQDRTIAAVSQTYLTTLTDSIPILGLFRRSNLELHLSEKQSKDEQNSSLQIATIAGGVLAGIGLVVGYLYHQGAISLGRDEPDTRESVGLAAFGEAGAALSQYATQMDAEVQRQKVLEAESNHPHIQQPAVEVESVPNGTLVKKTTG